jgi:hypothetical protein
MDKDSFKYKMGLLINLSDFEAVEIGGKEVGQNFQREELNLLVFQGEGKETG